MNSGLGSINGRTIANLGFVRALLQSSERMAVTLVVSSRTEQEFVQHHFQSLNPNVVPLLSLEGYLQQNPFDVIHLLSPNLYRGFYLRDRLLAQPCAVTGMTHSLGHDPFLEWMTMNLLAGPQAYDRLICTTPTAQQAIRRMQARKTEQLNKKTEELKSEVIPLGLSISDLQKPAPNVRTQYGIPAEAVVLLSLGRFSYYTKADLIPLLLIFREVVKGTKQEVRLLLAGAQGGESYGEMLQTVLVELRLQGKVLLIPNPDETLKRSLYQSANLFLALSDNYQETFGITLIEALASGLPIVASDWDGYRSIVVEGQNGYLIPSLGLAAAERLDTLAPLQLDSLNHLYYSQAVATDQVQFVKRVLALVDNPAQRARLAQQARVDAQSYDWSQVIRRYETLWRELAAQAKADGRADPSTSTSLQYSQVFREYPTRLFQDDMVWGLTPQGGEALQGVLRLRVYNAMEELLDQSLLAVLLQKVDKGRSGKDLLSLGKYDPNQVRYHLMWLYKYGLIQPKPS